jgi:D-methionine transport system substrate-binding protein
MTRIVTRRRAVTLTAAGTLALATRGALAQGSTPAGTPAETLSISVGATPVPHAEILAFVQETFGEARGIEIEIVEFTDYVQPNVALDEGDIDANYFQHQPYLDEFNEQRGTDLVSVAPVHIEPLGIYSTKVESLDDVEDGAQVAIPNDVTNGGRALKLLAANDLLELDEEVDNPSVRDITDNPRDLEIVELEAAQLPRSLEDVDIAVINGNYAIEADLSPAEDALALESGEDNPYANFLVVKEGNEEELAVVLLAELLQSDEVRTFIEETYEGAVIPAF